MDHYRVALSVSHSLVPSRPAPVPETQTVVSIRYQGAVFYYSDEELLYDHPLQMSTLTDTSSSLYPESTMQLQLQYVDDGAYRRGPTTKWLSTAFVFDGTDGSRHRSSCTYSTDTRSKLTGSC